MARYEVVDDKPEPILVPLKKVNELLSQLNATTARLTRVEAKLEMLEARHEALCKDFSGSCDAQSELNHRTIAFMDDFSDEFVEARHDQLLVDATSIVARMAEAIYSRRAEDKSWTTPWVNLNGKRKSDFMELGWAAYGAEHDEQ